MDCVEVPQEILKIKEMKAKGEKLTDSEKKKLNQHNKALANPGKAAAKKEKSDAKRARRKESGSVKVINR